MTFLEIKRNRRVVKNAIAQQELEGLKVPPETFADLHRIANGEITITEAIRNAYTRYSHHPNVQIFEP